MSARWPRWRSAPARSTLPPSLLIPLVMLAAARWPGRCCMLGAGAAQAAARRRRGGDHAAAQFHRRCCSSSMMLDGPMKDPMGAGLAADRRRSSPTPCCRKLIDADAGALRASSIALALAVLRLGLDLTRTVSGFEIRAVGEQRRAARFRRHAASTAHAAAVGAAVGRAGRPRRRGRGRGRNGYLTARPVAGLRLYRHRRRDAGGAQSARRRARPRSSSPACSWAPTA